MKLNMKSNVYRECAPGISHQGRRFYCQRRDVDLVDNVLFSLASHIRVCISGNGAMCDRENQETEQHDASVPSPSTTLVITFSWISGSKVTCGIE